MMHLCTVAVCRRLDQRLRHSSWCQLQQDGTVVLLT